jgi:hypothetical protein
MSIREIKARLEKKAGSKAQIVDKAAFNKQLEQLEEGEYELFIKPLENKLKRLKRYYFALESELSLHLGYTKALLHEQLKEYVGHHINPDNGKAEYLSISKVSSEEEMAQRVLELSEFAAKELNYIFKPFNKDTI